jgi:Concanavalin A-like lectin/glucanases superfamily
MNGYMSPALITAFVVGLSLTNVGSAQEKDPLAEIRKALTLSANFDSGPDADFAKGDKRIYTASSAERKDAKPGLTAEEFEVAKGQGRHGSDALRFIKKSNKVVFFKAAGNIDYRKENWSGTAAFWLNLDPQKDLGDWYCDPIQITEKAWNNGALWVDFSKDDKPKHFRLGAFADMKVWNPTNREFEKIPAAERPMVTVIHPPFASGKWTHVAFTFENFNTGKSDGVAKLYLNGKLQGAVIGRNQHFTWDPEKAVIQIGMSYVGLYDDLAIFNRSLSEAEIQALHIHEGRLAAPK